MNSYLPGELPSACHPSAPFLARIAVSVPVGLFSILYCFCAGHTDTPGAGNKGVGEPLQCPPLICFQGLTVLQLVVTLL